ncbi:hypothetical protein FP2506_12154 [Fulvimarina pelagi HTCC2506]|uniref:Uncharacterized protein n=1 Tax=Fulvimarina pelagi HTCC2506 TaxID=314231 RepID=Q0G1R5_9HYPH|nr:hypothetical protein FP2506_12154 [Fulvimarina pelagi HTCC2506]
MLRLQSALQVISPLGDPTLARNLRIAVVAFVVTAGLSACVSVNGGDISPQSLSERWRGQSADAFFARYGSPFAEYGERNGGVRYTWRKRYVAPSAAAGDGTEVRVCEIDLVTDASDRIQSIGATRNSKIRDEETPSCEGAFGVDAA